MMRYLKESQVLTHHDIACHINATTPTKNEPPVDTPVSAALLGFAVGVAPLPETRSASTSVPVASGAETEAEAGADPRADPEDVDGEAGFGHGF